MFGYLSYRHKNDSTRRGPWQSPQRVFFHNTVLQKRLNDKEWPVLQLQEHDLEAGYPWYPKKGLHWLGATSSPSDSKHHDDILKTLHAQLTRKNKPLVPGQRQYKCGVRVSLKGASFIYKAEIATDPGQRQRHQARWERCRLPCSCICACHASIKTKSAPGDQ